MIVLVARYAGRPGQGDAIEAALRPDGTACEGAGAGL